jgi:hypothetical protein
MFEVLSMPSNFRYTIPTRDSTSVARAIESRETSCGLIGVGLWGAFEHLKRQRWIRPILSPVLALSTFALYYQRVAPALALLFQRYGAALFNFQDPDSIGCTSGEFLDVFHESEVCAIRDLIAISSREEKARSILDVKKLEGFLNRRISIWQLGF